MSIYDKFVLCKLIRCEMIFGMFYLVMLFFIVDILNDFVIVFLFMFCCWDEKRFLSLDEKNVDEFILFCY